MHSEGQAEIKDMKTLLESMYVFKLTPQYQSYTDLQLKSRQSQGDSTGYYQERRTLEINGKVVKHSGKE